MKLMSVMFSWHLFEAASRPLTQEDTYQVIMTDGKQMKSLSIVKAVFLRSFAAHIAQSVPTCTYYCHLGRT
eukprot:scaffold19677_cov191-Skeletonema_dohrnii-CCMP3373.AAC.2